MHELKTSNHDVAERRVQMAREALIAYAVEFGIEFGVEHGVKRRALFGVCVRDRSSVSLGA